MQVIQYREQSDLAFMLLVKSQCLEQPIDLSELMKYSLTPVPHSLGTSDGFFNKTNKASMLHFLTDDFKDDVPYPTDKTVFIQDGNALFHTLSNLPPTFGEICLQLLDQMAAKKDFIFSTDCYHDTSIKSQERLRRGVSQQYIVEGPATRKPLDFKLFLANETNKKQLCQLLLKVWGSETAFSRIQKCSRAIAVVEGKAYHLKADDTNVRNRNYTLCSRSNRSNIIYFYILGHSKRDFRADIKSGGDGYKSCAIFKVCSQTGLRVSCRQNA